MDDGLHVWCGLPRKLGPQAFMAFTLLMACNDDDSPRRPADGGVDGSHAGDGGEGGPGDGDGDGDLDASGDGDDDASLDAGATSGDASEPTGDAGPTTLPGFLIADHCSPFSYSARGAGACNDSKEAIEAALASGIDPDDGFGVNVTWKALSKPMQAGKAYAISTELTVFEEDPDVLQLEIWGVMSQCALDGESAVLLATTPLDRGRAVYCVEMTPAQNFTHVLFVYRKLVDQLSDGYAWHGESYCLMGSCPAL